MGREERLRDFWLTIYVSIISYFLSGSMLYDHEDLI